MLEKIFVLNNILSTNSNDNIEKENNDDIEKSALDRIILLFCNCCCRNKKQQHNSETNWQKQNQNLQNNNEVKSKMFKNPINFFLCKLQKTKRNIFTSSNQKCLNRFNSLNSFQDHRQQVFNLTKRLTRDDESIKSLENMTINHTSKRASVCKHSFVDKTLRTTPSKLFLLNPLLINLQDANSNNNEIQTKTQLCLSQLSTRTVDSSSTFDIFETARTSKTEEILQYYSMAELIQQIRLENGCVDSPRLELNCSNLNFNKKLCELTRYDTDLIQNSKRHIQHQVEDLKPQSKEEKFFNKKKNGFQTVSKHDNQSIIVPLYIESDQNCQFRVEPCLKTTSIENKGSAFFINLVCYVAKFLRTWVHFLMQKFFFKC